MQFWIYLPLDLFIKNLSACSAAKRTDVGCWLDTPYGHGRILVSLPGYRLETVPGYLNLVLVLDMKFTSILPSINE